MNKTYHTDFKIKYKLGLLEPSILKEVPRTTLFHWRNKDFSEIVGSSFCEEEDIVMIKDFLSRKKLLQAAKALYSIFLVYQNIVQNLEHKNSVLLASKKMVIETIEKTRFALGFKRSLRMFSISYQQFYSWKGKLICQNSALGLCKKRHLLQLTSQEVDVIKEYLTKPELLHWSSASVYYQMLRDNVVYMALGTFYKYVNLLNLKRKIPNHRRKKHKIGIRAEKIFQMLHADMTLFRSADNVKIYIYILMDNFSRKILSWQASLEYSAHYTFLNLKEAFHKCSSQFTGITPELIVDGGSENKAEANEFINNHNITRIIAQKDIQFSNSMVEAVNKRLKYDFLFRADLQNFEQTIKHLLNLSYKCNS